LPVECVKLCVRVALFMFSLLKLCLPHVACVLCGDETLLLEFLVSHRAFGLMAMLGIVWTSEHSSLACAGEARGWKMMILCLSLIATSLLNILLTVP